MSIWLTKIKAAWQTYWFQERSYVDLAACRLLFYFSIIYLYRGNAQLTSWVEVPDTFWEPISFFRYLPFLPLPQKNLALVLEQIWFVSLFCSAIGLLTNISTKTSALLGLLILGYGNNFGKIHHSSHMVAVCLCIMAFTKCGRFWSMDQLWRRYILKKSDPPNVDSEYFWPLRTIQVYMLFTYFEAGFQKLRHSGLEWAFSDNMRSTLLAWGHPRGVFIAENFPSLTYFFAAWILLAEFFAFLPIFYPVTALFFVPALFLFHIGGQLTIGDPVTFTPLLFCYLFWVPWSVLIKKAYGQY